MRKAISMGLDLSGLFTGLIGIVMLFFNAATGTYLVCLAAIFLIFGALIARVRDLEKKKIVEKKIVEDYLKERGILTDENKGNVWDYNITIGQPDQLDDRMPDELILRVDISFGDDWVEADKNRKRVEFKYKLVEDNK